MLANYLIGLREGLEASLVVGILVAYLVKSGRTERLSYVWAGVSSAVLVSLGFGAALTFTSGRLSEQAQEAFGGVMSMLAVAFVTWMVFWMRRTARFLKAELEGRLAAALALGAFALLATSFVAVAREGLETSLFIWAAAQTSSSNATPLAGATLGLLTAAFLGWLMYRGAVRINLARFFKITGALLVVVAAGVFSYGFHDLQEAGLLPGAENLAFDISGQGWLQVWGGAPQAVLKGLLNFTPAPTTLQVSAWAAYLLSVMTAFLWPQRSRMPQPGPKSPVTTAR